MKEVIFGEVLSFTDLGLMLTDDGVHISTPDPKRVLTDVPGMDGSLELTYALSSKIRYKNRKIKLIFVMADYQYRWLSLFSKIIGAIHGKKLHVTIQPDDYYWDAFCTVSEPKSNRNKGTVVVELDAYPYKLATVPTTVSDSVSASSKTVTCFNASPMDAVPSFYADHACTIIYNSVNYDLTAETETVFDGIVFSQGNTDITISGTANVTIKYTEGIL